MSEWPGRLRFSPSRWRALYWPRCCADYPRRQKRRRFRIFILPVGSEVPTGVNPIALSPDGRQLAIASGGALWIRRLDEIAARPLAGTQVKPDALLVTRRAVRRLFCARPTAHVPVAGGCGDYPLCDAEFVPAGATWNRDDVILFAMVWGPADRRPNTMPVQRVPASGGKPHSISTPNEQTRGGVARVARVLA